MIELLEYACPKYSSFGFQWVKIGEYESQEEAEKSIEKLIRKGKNRNNFKTRVKVESAKKESSASFIFKKKQINWDMKHSERRRRWNSGNPKEII